MVQHVDALHEETVISQQHKAGVEAVSDFLFNHATNDFFYFLLHTQYVL